MKKVILLLATAMLVFSCANDQGTKTDASITVRDGETRSKLSSGSASAEELKEAAEKRKIEQQKREEERLANMTTMDISPKTFDFGDIAKETPVSTFFKITNTGDKPLIINDTRASCGCTVPQKPEEPILPGESYDLEVTFTSNPGQEGTAINKTITVSGNIDEGSQTVNIKANVKR